MANKPLQSIKFPDLPDTYTIPVVDSTLAVSGAAADAKKTGDELAKKVTAVSGKGLSTEDYTTEEKTKLADVETGATKTIIDNTLTQNGQAADAKTVGDAIANEDKKALAAFATDIASGSIAHFEDGADNIPMKDVFVHIEPVQEGSGDPSPDNVRPITGWTGTTVTKCGKNFLENTADSKVSAGITFRINSDKTVTVSGTATSSTNLNLITGFKIPKGEYILSGCPNGGSSSTYEILAVYNGATYRDYGNGVLLKVVDDNPIQYVQVVIRNGYTANNLIFEPMIRYSDSDPTYEPYSGQTYDITFPSSAGTVYGGTLDVTKGELVVDRAMIDMGTLTWTSWLEGGTYIFNAVVDRKKQTRISTLICSQYKPNYSVSGWRDLVDCEITGAYDNSRVYIRDQRFTDNAAFTTAMSGVPLVYELATPITYHLTPQEITSLLGANNLWADTGDSEVEYRADTKLYITKKITEAVSALS